MSQLIVDFITSLDGYASAEGWPGWWGLDDAHRAGIRPGQRVRPIC